jgi:signal transduction histidine kinase
MTSIKKDPRTFLLKHFYQFEKWRWVVIFGIGLGLFSVEVYEFIELSFLNQPLHLGEVFLYAILLICTGLFVELFVRSYHVQRRMVKILEYKHNLSLQLMLINDWDSLTARLVQLPGMIVKADEAYLMAKNLISDKFETLSHWVDNQYVQPAILWDANAPCKKCFEKIYKNNTGIHLCCSNGDASSCLTYSLSIANDNIPTILLKFKLKPGLVLTPDEEEALLNISDEIAMALRVGQDHKAVSELRSVEVAMAERRLVSAYVHDQLGQNLAFLHLKLDQLGTNEIITKSKETRNYLKQLRIVANESYEIVRDILKKMHPETIPHLTNLLKEHALTVSQAANFTLDFKSTGTPVTLATNTQHAIFYAFREILSNVEKHSKASMVHILVTWSDTFLDISVADNGVGFDPNLVNKEEHFGLDILQERVAGVNGKLMMNSSANSGTVVSISIPVKLPEKELHEQLL